MASYIEKLKNWNDNLWTQNSCVIPALEYLDTTKRKTYLSNFNTDGTYIFDSNDDKILDDDTPEIAQNFIKFLNRNLAEESTLGFAVPVEETDKHIYIPEVYKPESNKDFRK